MTLYECDKCGQRVTSQDKLWRVGVPSEHVANSTRHAELCQGCLLRLKDWLQPDVPPMAVQP